MTAAEDLHQIQGVIDLARDDADETELLLEVTGGPLAFLTMGPEPEQTIRVSPKQAREVAAKLVAWAAVHDGEGPMLSHPLCARCARPTRSNYRVGGRTATNAGTAYRSWICGECVGDEAEALEPVTVPTREMAVAFAKSDTERPLAHLADALSQEGSDPR